jgi:hypothetical protein
MSDTNPKVEPIDPPDDTTTSEVQNPDPPSAGDFALIDPPDDTKKKAAQ